MDAGILSLRNCDRVAGVTDVLPPNGYANIGMTNRRIKSFLGRSSPLSQAGSPHRRGPSSARDRSGIVGAIVAPCQRGPSLRSRRIPEEFALRDYRDLAFADGIRSAPACPLTHRPGTGRVAGRYGRRPNKRGR